MAESVTLPGVGPVSKRALLFGGGGVAAVLGVLYWRRRQAAAPAAAAADPSLTDTSLSDLAGAGSGGGAGGVVSPVDTSGPIATNSQWNALVVQQLGGVVDPSTLQQALGLYLTGQAVSHDQELIIDQAIAAAGYPPVAGPAGYPPAIRQSPAGGQAPPPHSGGFTDVYVTVRPGDSVVNEIHSLQKHGWTGTYDTLVALNPEVVANIKTSPQHATHPEWDSFIRRETYRLV